MVDLPNAGGSRVGAAPPASSQPRRLRHRPVAAPMPSAETALAVRAAELTARLAAPTSGARWAGQGFAAEVDRVRHQLGPLRDRRMLAASYERESVRLAALRRLAVDPAAPPLPLDPIDVAYAIRWLELTEGAAPLPAWAELVAGVRGGSSRPG